MIKLVLDKIVKMVYNLGRIREQKQQKGTGVNIQSARNVSEFVHVLARDDQNRPTRLLVPGHKGKQYVVTLNRNGGLKATCKRKFLGSGEYYTSYCQGNQHGVCYHALAACITTASEQGKQLSWCETEQDA